MTKRSARNKRTLEMLYVDEREKPLSLQIFGGDRESLVEAAKLSINNQCGYYRYQHGLPGSESYKM